MTLGGYIKGYEKKGSKTLGGLAEGIDDGDDGNGGLRLVRVQLEVSASHESYETLVWRNGI